MILDSSAILAVLFKEAEADRMISAIELEFDRYLSAASLLECSVVVEARHGSAGVRELDALLAEMQVETVAFDRDQAILAREAYRNFGKGRHPAGLNFGDCFAYALARYLDQPLLFKGDDFSQTDLTPALLNND